jgi:hypothetical protein
MNEAIVHLVSPYVEEYGTLLLDVPEAKLPPPLHGYAWGDTWHVLPVYKESPLAPQPDVWWVWGLGGFAFSPESVEDVEPFLSRSGELLPVAFSDGGGRLHVLNVTRVVDCLDLSVEEWEQGLAEPRFVEHRLGESELFKVPLLAGAHTFCLEWAGEESFRSRVEENGLSGLGFTTVWTSSGGPAVPNLMRM